MARRLDTELPDLALIEPEIHGDERGFMVETFRADAWRELEWVIDRAEEHFGPARAASYLRKFYPWYLERLGASRDANEPLQRAGSLDAARRLALRTAERTTAGAAL